MAGERLVIDASVLAQVYIQDEAEHHTGIASAILRRYAEGDVQLVAPEFILYEVPSAIERAVRRGRVDGSYAAMAIQRFFRLQLRIVGRSSTLPAMISSAYSRASELGCRMYDALYVVVAEALGCRFVTADRKLYDTIHAGMDGALWIEDYSSDA